MILPEQLIENRLIYAMSLFFWQKNHYKKAQWRVKNFKLTFEDASRSSTKFERTQSLNMPHSFRFLRFVTIGLFWGSILFPLHMHSQWSSGAHQSERTWRAAEVDWEHAKYASAMNRYETWLEQANDHARSKVAIGTFRIAACAIHLQHADAESRIQTFMDEFPESPMLQEAQWMYANHLYRKRDWRDVIEAFDVIKTTRMPAEKKLELTFKKGHAKFELERYDEARLDLYSVMEAGESAGIFADNSKYYFSHISYIKGQPQVALTGFQELANHPNFGDIVPIYIAQLLHETEQYDALIEYAPQVLHPDSRINEIQRADVSRLVGDALYRKQDFSGAYPYLEEAYTFSRGRERTRDFSYQMGYVYYQEKEYRKAINCLTLSVREDDAMAQNALYHMADCYMGLLERDKARTTFKKASQLDFDPEIREDALFSYAKLAYELTYNPFDDAIGAIERYLRETPNSERKDEALGFLLEVYMSSKNYDRALSALKQIKEKTLPVKQAYQMVAYNRGVELFRSGNYAESVAYFDDVRTYPINPLLTAESHFWLGELNYLLKRYTESTGHYANFESAPGAYQSSHYADGIYGRGYALFKRKKYIDALSAFRSFLKSDPQLDERKTRDAKLRTADCFFANKDFEAASRYYNEVIHQSDQTEEYARIQGAECLGSLNRPLEKIAALNELIERAPSSNYTPEALYALGRSCIETNQLDEARTALVRLRTEFPNSPRNKYALVDLCLIGVKQGAEEEVLSYWDIIRTEYGQDAIAGDAFNVVEPLLIDRGFLDNIPSGVGLNGDQIEERLFDAARSLAMERNCEKAISRLEEFIRAYEQGRFLTEAHFFLGNCAFDEGEIDVARSAFDFVLNQPAGDYTEIAALGAATMAWNASDLTSALRHYSTLESVSVLRENQLEARIGLMRCHYLLDDFDAAKNYANQVVDDPQTPDDIKRTALYWRGKIRYDEKDYSAAKEDLKRVAEYGGSRGAECQYLLCTLIFQEGDFSQTEAALFELIDAFAAYDEWKFKAFLLLVECYIELEDWFQARTTAQSLLDNVSEDQIQQGAQEQLARINELEALALAPAPTLIDSLPGTESHPLDLTPDNQ